MDPSIQTESVWMLQKQSPLVACYDQHEYKIQYVEIYKRFSRDKDDVTA